MEHAVRDGDLELVARLAAKMSNLAHQGKANEVKQLFFSAAETSDDLKCLHKLGGVGQRTVTLQGALLPVIKGRLYLTSASSTAAIQPKKRELWVAVNQSACYTPLCAEFGPLNLGTTHRMCKKLHALLACPKHHRTKIIFCTSTEAADITNTVTLLGAFLCLRMGYTVAQALRPFMDLQHSLIIPFRDATWATSTFNLHVRDCLAGLHRAVSAGIFKLDEFDHAEYVYYDDPRKGDMHEVLPGKFIAFRGPMRDHGREGTLEPGDSTLSASDYLDAFKHNNVSTIIRLDATQYSADVFKRAGFTHFDLPFEDCEVPSDSIVDKFLRIAEEARGVVAVHCSSGRGRTGTLIALYLMKHHGFTAREAMGWLRICRPGSVIGPQQHYLEVQESRMHMLCAGGQGCAGLLGGRSCSAPDLGAATKVDCFRRASMADGRQTFGRARSCELDMGSIEEETVSTPNTPSPQKECKKALPDAPRHDSTCSSSNSNSHADRLDGDSTHGPNTTKNLFQALEGLNEDYKAIPELRMITEKLDPHHSGMVTKRDIADALLPPARASLQPDFSAMIAQMASQGMHRRDCLRVGGLTRSDTWGDYSDPEKPIKPTSESVCSRADTFRGSGHVEYRTESEALTSFACSSFNTVNLMAEKEGHCLPSEAHSEHSSECESRHIDWSREAEKEGPDAHDTFLFAQSDLLLSLDDALGEGSAGTVYSGIFSNEVKIEVAVKVMHANMSEDDKHHALAELRQEIVVGKIIPTHPNLPVFVGWCATQSMGPMVMWKQVCGQNLDEVFAMHRMRCKKKHAWRPKEQYVLSWSRQLFSALACLHSHGFMHCDVKPTNIMMDEQHKLIVLVDFGLCRTISTANGENVRRMTGNTGTYGFMAPEVSREEQYDAKVDVYSGSMVVCFMLFGDMPFPKIPGFAVLQLMERERLRPNLTSCKNKELAKLLTRAWDKNPHLRPHAHEMEAELRILHDDLIRRKENAISSKVLSALSRMSSTLFRTQSTDSLTRVSSTLSCTSSAAESISSNGLISQSSTCDEREDPGDARGFTRAPSAYSTSSDRSSEGRGSWLTFSSRSSCVQIKD